jgi:hypothetical protein
MPILKNSTLFLILFLWCTIAMAQQIPKVAAGTIKHFQNFKSKFVAARNVDV